MNMKFAVYSLFFSMLSFGLSATAKAAPSIELLEKVNALTRSYVLCLENWGKEDCRDIYDDLLRQQTELELQRQQDNTKRLEVQRDSRPSRNPVQKPRNVTRSPKTINTPIRKNPSVAPNAQSVREQLSRVCDHLTYGSLERRHCRAEAKQRFRENCYSKNESINKLYRQTYCSLSESYPIVE